MSYAGDVIMKLSKEVEQIHSSQPNLDHFGRCYVVASRVLKEFLGIDWLEQHVMGTSAPTDFFRNDWATSERKNVHVLRVIQLAEMLLNLQPVPDFREVIDKLKTDPAVEATFAELEVGRLLFLNRVPFRFVKRRQRKGSDYDLELNLNGVIVCADTKCKLESTARGLDTIVTSLKDGRKQLPNDKPGMFFVKVPQSWNPQGDDFSHIKDFDEIAKMYFFGTGAYKGTEHVVSIAFYFSLALDFGTTASILLAYEVENPRHRHTKEVNYKILGSPDTSKWIDIKAACE
jgi:hypothetical protein